MSIYLTAILQCKPTHSETFKVLLKQLEFDSNQEEACLKYELHQSIEDENTFIFLEIWQDQEGLDLHNQQPHLKSFQVNVADIIAGPAIIYKTQIVN